MKPGWIAHSWGKDVHPAGGYPLAFRQTVTLAAVPPRAVVLVTASPHYLLWVNGVFVAEGPARCYPARQLTDELDLASYLQPGRNEIAVLLPKPSGVTGYSLLHRMGLWMSGWLNTDTTWKVRLADWYLRTPWLFTLPLGSQEHFDAQREPEQWRVAPPDASWTPAFCLGGEGTPPWTTLTPSGLPQSLRTEVTGRLIWSGTTSRERCDVRLVNLAHEFGTRAFRQTPPGGDSSNDNLFVFDFGKTGFFSVGARVSSCSAGTRLEFFYGIVWNGSPASSRGFGHEDEGCVDTATAGEWRSLAPRGFRYLTVRVTGEGPCDFQLTCQRVDYPYPQKSCPVAAEPFLSALWEVSRATLLSSTTDQLGEPARENVLWTLDACVAGKAAWHTFGDAAIWRHCLLLIADGIDAEGVPHAVVPAGDSFMILIDQTLGWVVSCREYGELTGDTSLAPLVAPAIARFLSLCARHMTADGLFVPPGYAWHWIDWAKLDKRPYAFPVNALLLWAAQAASSLARTAGVRIPPARPLVRTLRRSLMTFWDDHEGGFCSRRPFEIDEPWNTINTTHPMETTYPVSFDLHSNALAWWTGLGTPRQRRRAVTKMLSLLQASHEGTLGYGPLFGNGWTQLILGPVFEAGHTTTGLEVLRRLFQPWLDRGAPTWGEDFVPALDNTAHAWGASVNSLLIEQVLPRLGGVD